MAIKFSLPIRNSLASVIISAIDFGGAAGRVKIYSGTQPVTPLTAPSGTILSEHDLAYPCGSVVNGVIVFGAISEDDFANATGTATWARFTDSTGAAVADASISVAGGTGDLQMNTTAVVVNGPVRFTSLQWTMPGA